MATQRTRPLKLRSATPATPAATPPAVETPVQTRTQTATPAVPAATPPAAPRPVADVTAERDRLLGQADALQTRSRTEALSADDETQLDQLLDRIEVLNEELPRSRRAERLAAQRSIQATPTRPAPVFTPAQRHQQQPDAAELEGEALQIWLRSFTDDPDTRPDANFRASRGGFNPGSPSARIPCNYGSTLNRAKRRTLSKGGAGTGQEWVPVTFSSKVTEYISFFSPIVGLVDSEVTGDGNKRTYFKVDDTSLMSSYITASAGTETSPTIPDKDVTTAGVDITVADITSGYHKMTKQVLRDSAVSITDKVTKAIGNSHARRIESDVINGTGNGSTSIQGLLASATTYGDPIALDGLTPELMEAIYFSVPVQYRAMCVWLFSSTAMAKAVDALKDAAGRSLFGKTSADGLEIRTLHERPVYESQYMPAWDYEATPIWFGAPGFYMLRLVDGQNIDVLREKFYPHLAFTGGMAFGGAYLGPASTSAKVEIEAEA